MQKRETPPPDAPKKKKVMHVMGVQLSFEDGQTLNVPAAYFASEGNAEEAMVKHAHKLRNLLPLKLTGSLYKAKDVLALLGIRAFSPYTKPVEVVDQTESPPSNLVLLEPK